MEAQLRLKVQDKPIYYITYVRNVKKICTKNVPKDD